MYELSNEERIKALLVEYSSAQNSAQHHDTLVWNSIGIIWSAQLVLLGFIIQAKQDLHNPLIILFTSVLALVLLLYLSISYFSIRKIRNQKYKICKEIEKKIDLSQHSSLKHKKYVGTISFCIVTFFFMLVWLLVIFMLFIDVIFYYFQILF